MEKINSEFTLPLYTQNVEGDFQPFLEFYPLAKKSSPLGGVLVIPGGGYGGRSQHEAKPVAERYNQLGFHAFVLQYRVSPSRFPAPQQDVFAAIKILRSMSGELNLAPDQIAVCGFSAGGHLAASAGTLAEEFNAVDSKPNAMILSYPVISLAADFAHRGSGENLLGENFTPENAEKYSLEKRVNKNTPPSFLWHTADDELVPVKNSLVFFENLRKYDVTAELHIFPHGPHGLGLAPEFQTVAIWPELSSLFLVEQCGFDNINTVK